MTKRSFRLIQNTLAFVTFLAVFFSFYSQYVMGYNPCPLCLMQRFCAGLLLLAFLMGMLSGSIQRAKHLSLIQAIVAAFGLFFATRQLWLQSMTTPESSACLPGIDMLIKYFPWQKLVHLFLWGSNSCGEVGISALGLSMAGWSAIFFGSILLLCGILFCRLILTPLSNE